MKTSKRGRKIGRPRRFERRADGMLVERKDYHDRRDGRRKWKELHLDEVDDHVDDSDPGAEGSVIVYE